MVARVVVTGGAGNIAYSLLFRIASGELLGNKPLSLHILELPQFIKVAEGVKMELEDCAFPLLQEVHIGSDPCEVFADCDYALLIGAQPRGPGMERADLLSKNGEIFREQGKALDLVAKRSVKVFVVGNPCNTNCLITMNHAPGISRKNFFAMTRLDQNRSAALLAKKAGVGIDLLNRVTIWGNHSSTQVPDFVHAEVAGRALPAVIEDHAWLEGDFVESVQQRGAAIIAARGSSSAASAAHAVLNMVHSVEKETPEGEWYSMGVCSDGNTYGIEENLIFSFPCRTTASGEVEIVEGLSWNSFLKERILASEIELLEERRMAFNE